MIPQRGTPPLRSSAHTTFFVSGMDNPQGDQANAVSGGFVHLDAVIAKRSCSFEPSGVVPCLKERPELAHPGGTSVLFVSCRLSCHP